MESSGSVDGLTGFGIVLSSAVCFHCAGVGVARFLTPDIARPKKAWQWKNIVVSFLHAVITGLWAVITFYNYPKMAEDLISTHNTSAQILIATSVGYFVYDSVDMLRFQRTRQSLELLLHHAVILLCFGITIATQLYVGYAVVALIVELNSIFLHLRQILQMLKFPKDSAVYRLNSLINLGTYIVFRIALLAWMTRWLVVNHDRVPLPLYTTGSLGLAIITVMNIVLFYRLLRSDFIRKKDKELIATKQD